MNSEIQNTTRRCLPAIYIGSEPQILHITEKHKQKFHGTGIVTHLDKPTDQSADAFTDIDDINKMVEYLLEKHWYCKAALFVFGINTGYRCGDSLAFRVRDFYDEYGNFRDVIYVREGKTGKSRPVYFNQAVKIAVEYAIKHNKLTADNYVFRADGSTKKAYIADFKYNKDGYVKDIITSPTMYDEQGNIRERAPMTIGTVIHWMEQASTKLGIYGHYSSHTMRQTFAEFIGRGFDDNRNVAAVCAALGHSDPKITAKHYMGIDPLKLRDKWLNLNLGIEPYQKLLGEEDLS